MAAAAASVYQGRDNSDFDIKMKNSIVGGPAIIFKRLVQPGSRIRNNINGKFVKQIIGFDCTAMYGQATALPQCTGVGRRWTWIEAKDIFQQEPFYEYANSELEWLSWVAHSEGIQIEHRWNTGRVVNVHGQFPDGFCRATNTCYFFDGCYWHGHACKLTAQFEGKQVPPEFENRPKRDAAIRAYLRSRGYRIVQKRECDWHHQREYFDQREFVRKYLELPEYSTMTQKYLLDMVADGEFFGMVRCDIEVPDEHLEFWADLPPIFKNTLVGLEDIGEHMRGFCVAHGILEKPRRTLISSYVGNDIMLGTPLLKWLLEHGLRVTKVHEAFEFKPAECFKGFIEKATNIRRQADVDPERFGILGAMEKLKVNW